MKKTLCLCLMEVDTGFSRNDLAGIKGHVGHAGGGD